MFTAAVGSLLWKEYRVQRALWCFLCALVLVLQILLRIAFFTTTSSPLTGASNDELWATGAMWFVTFAAQVGFVFASVAIAFAGEREDRTCDMLVQLSPPPGAVLLVKLGTCLGGCLALYVCGALVTLLLGRFVPGNPYVYSPLMFINQPFESSVAFRGAIIFGLLVWCTFGSLLSQRVLISIPMMAVGWVVTCWIPLAIMGIFLELLPQSIVPLSADGSVVLIGFALVVLGMIALDLWLGYRWVQGQYYDFQFLADYRDFWSIAWHDVRNRSSRASRIPRGIEFEESERRPWQRLVWQERHRHWFVRWMATATCVCSLFTTLVAGDQQRGFGVPSVQDSVVGLLGLVMGVLAFRSEGEGQPVRFLANHGASPGMIWKSKHAVWMTRALVTAAILLLVFTVGDTGLYSEFFSRKERYLWLILLSYGCGQLAAMLLHRAILAAVAGATATGILFYWVELMRGLNMPAWWSLGIPALALLLATRLNVRSWLLEESTWQQKIRLLAVLIGLPLFTISIVATFRAFEVSTKASSWEKGPVFQNDMRWEAMNERGNLPIVSSPSTTSLAARLLVIAETPAERVTVPKSGANPGTLTEQGQRLADEVASHFATPSTVIHGVIDQSDHLFTVGRFDKLSDLLLARAQGYLQANELQPAFEMCIAHLNACQAMARGPFTPCWQAGAERERRSLDLLVEWANHPAVSAGEIHGAIKDLEQRLGLFPTPSSAIIDELVEAMHGSIIEQYGKAHGGTLGWEWIWLQLPWEVSRRHELWQREASLHRTNLSYLAIRMSGWTVKDNHVPVGDDYLKVAAGLQATTWGAEVALARDRSDIVRDRFTVAKATVTRMGIIAYRKQHGKMPADLDALFGIVRQTNLLDPWSSGRFEYRTAGLISQGNSQAAIQTDSQNREGTASRPLVASRFVFPIPPASADQQIEPSAPADQGRGR